MDVLVYPICRELLGLLFPLFHCTTAYIHRCLLWIYSPWVLSLMFQRHENGMAESPGCMQDVLSNSHCILSSWFRFLSNLTVPAWQCASLCGSQSTGPTECHAVGGCQISRLTAMWFSRLWTINLFKTYWLLHSLPGLTFKNSSYFLLTFCLCVVYGFWNKQCLLLYTTLTDWFRTSQVESVYCAITTEFVNKTDTFHP